MPVVSNIYSFAIWFYSSVANLLAIVHSKARERKIGLKDNVKLLTKCIEKNKILVHCASHGEYEQARPIIDRIVANTNYHIVLSFFSPSGYNEVNIDSSKITKVYLPYDRKRHMKKFIDLVNPKLVLIIKNEWWWNMLSILQRNDIETFLISATIRPSHYFIKYPISFFKKRISAFDKVFVIDKESKVTLKAIYSKEIIVSGDTRVDRVLHLKQEATNHLQKIKPLQKAMVYGSAWQADIPAINQLIQAYPDHDHYIFPHDISNENCTVLKKSISNAEIVTQKKEIGNNHIQIIQIMGLLKYFYHHAMIGYVGGGFGKGIHNILEASVYNIPVIIGPNYQKSNEAKFLINQKLVFVINDKTSVSEIKTYIEKNQKSIYTKLNEYFSESNNATSRIYNLIFNNKD